MRARSSTIEAIAYWGTLLFATVSIGYLLVVLIDTSQREETAFLQEVTYRHQPRFITFETTLGVITIALEKTAAPMNVANFSQLARIGFYDQTKFHRIVKRLLIQGGDPSSRTNDAFHIKAEHIRLIKDEISPDTKMARGVVAMVNQGDPNMNGSQFFILVAPEAPLLDGKYTIVGRVVSGMNIVDKINSLDVDTKNTPITPVLINATIID
jgi:peptidyl-prolyl cis-trans isomerase-like 1